MSIECIDLSNNELVCIDFTGIKLPNLKILKVRNNQLCEIKGLEYLDRLEQLLVDNNKLTCIYKLNGLLALSNLWRLNLSHNQISKIEVLELGQLSKLKELNLSHNQISNMLSLSLSAFNNLYELNLSHNQISKIEGLDELINLDELYLNNNQISKIEGLDELINLNELYLSHNQISKIEGLES